MAREFDRVGVVGLGTMGAGIVEVFARSGLEVVAVEVDEAAVTKGRETLEGSTGRALKRNKISAEDRDALLERVTVTTEMSALADVPLVVEAVPERLELKAEVLAMLDKACGPDTIFASNTSSLSLTELAVRTERPGKVVGMHFFNPATVQPLIELVRTVVTEPNVVEDVFALGRRLGKNPVVCGDRAGFIANSLLFTYLNQAVGMFEANYASREDLDAAMKFGCGYPMGPLALMDLIGLDTAYEILEEMYGHSQNQRHAPAPVLKQMITAGLLGRKSGAGFYTYAAPASPEVVADKFTPAAPGTEDDAVRPIATVGVVGTGTMATGIAEVFAKAGRDVVVRARTAEKGEGVVAAVRTSLEKAVTKGKLSEVQRDETLRRLRTTTAFDDFAQCDLVVEAVAEELEVKQGVFAELDRVAQPGAILATTTSSLPVVECAAATSRPADVIGMHFFNPATLMKLVEVVSPITTTPDVIASVRAECAAIGKHPVLCGDRAGFIVNALLFPYLNDATAMLEANYATLEDIDAAMTDGCGLPMGPFALLDVVGLDVSLAIERSLHQEFRVPGFAPAPLLEHLVTAGRLGRKTGQGFRDHARR